MRTVPADLAKQYEAAGWWTRDTLGDLLARRLAEAPDLEFRVHSEARPWAGTFRDVELVARRLAGGLRERGVGPGDVVVFQLPNWMEAAAVFWATALLGAVMVPVVHFYGRKEVGYILGSVKPKVFIGTGKFGHLEFQPDLVSEVPVVGAVGGDLGALDFSNLLAGEPMAGLLPADPAGPALIAFTSGTTRDPKGVIHSHQTLGFETRQLAARYPADRGQQLTAAPVGHFIGMINAFLIPLLDGKPIHLTDGWDPARVLRIIEEYGVVPGGGAPYYMSSLLDHPGTKPSHVRQLKYSGMGGAPVPPALSLRLEEHGVTVFRSYGSTEHPSITASEITAPLDKRVYTDGVALDSVEIRLTGEGEILSRGADLCLGYTDDELTARVFDADGWYHTGDIGVLDDDGYLTIVDRKADVIIRGGENVSALEVEDLLLTMDGVAEVAVVAAPDARLGEHGAAMLRMRPGQPAPDLARIRAHLEQAGLARQKWPEEVHVVEDFPRTASGKVQKFRLRQSLRESGS
jgi:acyl-CoA synthetase (AMP-forming)/AMP-acid ligase II